MDLVTIVGFIMFFALTVLFSFFSIALRKAEWSFTAMICWWAFALLNIGFATDALFYPITTLYWVLGLLFMFFGIRDILAMYNFRKQQKAEEDQWELE